MAVRMSTGGRRVQRYYETENTFNGPSLCDEFENKKFLKLQKRLRDFQGYMKKRLQELYDERGEGSDDEEIEDLRGWIELSNNPSADAEFGIETIEETVTDLLNYFRQHPIMMDDEDEKMGEDTAEGQKKETNEELKQDGEQNEKMEVENEHDGKSANECVAPKVQEENVMIRNPLGPEVPDDQPPPEPRPSLLSGTGVSPVGAGRGVRRVDMEDRMAANNRTEVHQSNGLHGFQEDGYQVNQMPYGQGFMPMHIPHVYMMQSYGVHHPSHRDGGFPVPMMNGFSHPNGNHHRGRGSRSHGQNRRRKLEQSIFGENLITDDQFIDADACSEIPAEEESGSTSTGDETVQSVPEPNTDLTSESEASISMSFSEIARECFESRRRDSSYTTPKKKNTGYSGSTPLQQTPRSSYTTANIAATVPVNEGNVEDNSRIALRKKLNIDIFTQLFRVGQKQKIAEEFEAQPERGRHKGKTPRKDRPTVTPSKSRADLGPRKFTEAAPPPRQRSRSVGPENSATPRKSADKEHTRKSPIVALPFPRISSNKRNRVIYTSSEEDSDSEVSKDSEESQQPQRDRRSRSVSRGPTNRRSKSIPRRIDPPEMENPEEQARKQSLILEYLTKLQYSKEDISAAMKDPDLYIKLTEMLHEYIPDLENGAAGPPAPAAAEPEVPQAAEKSPTSPPLTVTPIPIARRFPSPDPSIISIAAPDPTEPPAKKPKTISVENKKRNPPVYRPTPSITSGGYGEDTDDDTLSLISISSSVRRAINARDRDSTSSDTQYKPPDAFANTATDKVKIETDYVLPTVKVEHD